MNLLDLHVHQYQMSIKTVRLEFACV